MNNMPENFVRNSTGAIVLADPDRSSRISARELHKYVVGLVGIFGLFIITYPIAIHRVTQAEKFAPDRSHLKSLTLEYRSLDLTAIERR